jgi:hypothetical protein
MGLFDRKPEQAAPAFTKHELEGETILAPAGAPVRPRQADPGGQTTRYRLLGRNDAELGFITPAHFSLICEHGEFKIGDELELTLQEHQVFSKNAVLVPVDAL